MSTSKNNLASMPVQHIEEVVQDFFESSWWSLLWDEEVYEIPGLGTVKHVDSHGGHEGAGEEMWVVFSVTDGDVSRIFRKDGYYASWDGSDWDGDFREVKPKLKTITVWE